MSKTQKIILLSATLLPVLLFMAYIIVFFLYFFNIAEIINTPTPDNFYLLLILIISMVIIQIILFVFYSIHIFKNRELRENNKLLWFLVILLGSSLGQLIYFFRVIKLNSDWWLPGFSKSIRNFETVINHN